VSAKYNFKVESRFKAFTEHANIKISKNHENVYLLQKETGLDDA